MSEPKRPIGRPTKYDPAYCDEVVEFAIAGGTLAGFAVKIGVSRDTLTEWGQVHPDFSAACARAKTAIGFRWEQRAEKVGDKGGGPGTAAIVQFNLKNHLPGDYADKVVNEHTGKDGGPIKTEDVGSKLPPELIRALDAIKPQE